MKNGLKDFDEIELNAVLLACFFSCNLTQKSFSIISDLINSLTGSNLPNSIDKVLLNFKRFYSETNEYERDFYCAHCVMLKEITNLRKKTCDLCNNKYEYVFYFHLFEIF